MMLSLLLLVFSAQAIARDFYNAADSLAFKSLALESISRFPGILKNVQDIFDIPKTDAARSGLLENMFGALDASLSYYNSLKAFEYGPQELDPQARFSLCLNFAFFYLQQYVASEIKEIPIDQRWVKWDLIEEQYRCMVSAYSTLFP